MSIMIRFLFVAAVFLATTVAVYFVDNSLDIESGSLGSVVSVGVIAAVTGIAWRNAFAKRPQSN
jgi:hypothetical protein